MSAKKPTPKKTRSTQASSRPTWHGRPIPPEIDIQDPPLKDLPRTVLNWPRLGILGLVRLYQATFSHALPVDSCRFYPSCSHYGYQAIYKYGVIKGGLMTAWRILRCNPLNPGGFDPVQ